MMLLQVCLFLYPQSADAILYKNLTKKSEIVKLESNLIWKLKLGTQYKLEFYIEFVHQIFGSQLGCYD